MLTVGVNFLDGIAVAAALTVALVLAASLTVLPALLSRFGERVVRGGRLARRRAARRAAAREAPPPAPRKARSGVAGRPGCRPIPGSRSRFRSASCC